jgi:t-SNARE complex subunit (syntaxin)
MQYFCSDMAVIVKRQGEMVEEIATNAEASHEQAQAGLDQVKQAASYQTTCILS